MTILTTNGIAGGRSGVVINLEINGYSIILAMPNTFQLAQLQLHCTGRLHLLSAYQPITNQPHTVDSIGTGGDAEMLLGFYSNR